MKQGIAAVLLLVCFCGGCTEKTLVQTQKTVNSRAFEGSSIDIVEDTPKIDYQKAADGAGWGWSAAMATPLYSITQAGDKYDVHFVNPSKDRSRLTIRVMVGQKEIYEWLGHTNSVFRILGDRLYYADFGCWSSGGMIVAVDLTTGNELWRNALKALGPIQHSVYSNRLNLDANYDVISVFGNESMGRYIEIKDAKTGQTVGHRPFNDQALKL